MKYLWLLALPVCLALHMEEPSPPPVTSREEQSEQWLDVRLNQFDASNTETFPMRYYYNGEFGGPNVVIVVGGEWEITPGWTRGGLPYELAGRIGAGVFYTEHRYYGQSRPSNDTSVSNLRFLSVDQALADLAQFIQHVRSPDFDNGQYQPSRNGSVILVGCSYAGSMATWMRLAYPHLVDAAYSDSGPLHAQEDFPEYLEVIAEALRVQGGEACLSAVEESMTELAALLATTEGLASVSTLFNTCSPLSPAPLDGATFSWFGITETFAYLVQYAQPGDIADACTVLTAPSVAPIQRLANWITSQSWTQPCIRASYNDVVLEHTNTSYDATQSVMRLWTYQTCVEYGWYQTTSSPEQPFLSAVPLEYFHHMCKDFFSGFFDEEFLRSGIERTNRLFAGLTHMPDYVVSVAGGHDPWRPVGPDTTHATDKSPVYVVPEVSHCRVFASSNQSEPVVIQARENVLDFLYEVAVGPVMVSSASQNIASVLMIALIMLFVNLNI